MEKNDLHNKWANFKDNLEDKMADDIPEKASIDIHEQMTGLPPQDHKTPEQITLLENELDQAQLLAQSRQNDYLRAMAEMGNLRKRNEIELSNAHKFGIEKFLRALLPVADSLEKSLEHATDENLRRGVQMTLDLLLDAFRKHNVEIVDPIGQNFDPTKHEAVSTIATNEHAPNTVIQVLQKAYLLNDRLIRPALVIVSKAG